MKNTQLLFVLLLSINLASCFSCKDENTPHYHDSSEVDLSHLGTVRNLTSPKDSGTAETIKETEFFRNIQVPCGKNQNVHIDIKIINPKSSPQDGNEKYLVVLGDTPTTLYFSEQNAHTGGLIEVLRARDEYRIIQVKYGSNPIKCGRNATLVDGFGSACCLEGVEAVIQHNDNVMKKILEVSGFHQSTHSKKTLMGIGYGTGTIQFSTIAYESGHKFDKVALIRPLLGDVVKGCEALANIRSNLEYTVLGYRIADWVLDKSNLIAFTEITDGLDLFTTNGTGCTDANSDQREFREEHSLMRLRSFQEGELAVFDGDKAFDLGELEKLATGPLKEEYIFIVTQGLKTFADYIGGERYVNIGINTASKAAHFGKMGVNLLIDFFANRTGSVVARSLSDKLWLANKRYNPTDDIKEARNPGGTLIKKYPNCGRYPWNCDKGQKDLNNDILIFLEGRQKFNSDTIPELKTPD